MPFSVGDEIGNVAAVVAFRQLQVDPTHVVRPRPELHLTQLVVERKPRDVDGTRRDVKTERNPGACAVRRHDDVRGKLTVYVLVRAAYTSHNQIPVHTADADATQLSS